MISNANWLHRTLALFLAANLSFSPIYAQMPTGWVGIGDAERRIAMEYARSARLAGSAEEWLQKKDALLAQLRALWQREQLDQSERGTRESRAEDFSRRAYADWVVQHFLGSQKQSWRAGFEEYLLGLDDIYVLQRDPHSASGEYLKDADGQYILRGRADLVADTQAWRQQADTQRQALLRQIDGAAEGIVDSQWLRFGGELGLNAQQTRVLLQEQWQRERRRVARQLELQQQYSTQRFLQLRSYDQASRRRGQEGERAAAAAARIADGVSGELAASLQALESRGQAVGVGAVEPQLEADSWQREFMAVYERGMDRWNEAERALLAHRKQWEADAAQNYREGEGHWQQDLESR